MVLVVFEKRRHNARQSQRRSVQCVHEFVLAVLVLEAALQAVGLERLEVGDGAHLQPTFLCSRPNLKVVRHGTGEAHVSTAQTKDAVRQFKPLEQSFHVLHHGVQRGVAVVGMRHLNDFHLVELVQAVEAADVLSVAARFTTEARGVPTEFLRQVARTQNDVAEDVGQRHLRRRNHVEVVLLHVVHLAFFVWQLPGAVSRVGIHHVRWDVFCVSGFVGALQKEADESALEFGPLAFVEGEAGARDLGAKVEVDQVKLFRDVPMRLGVSARRRRFAAAEDLHVVVC